jgi:hypothetical protein
MVNCKLVTVSIFTPGHTPDVVSPDAAIVGVAIDLPNGLSDSARQTIDDFKATMATNPFQDDFLISQLRDGEEDGVVERDDD